MKSLILIPSYLWKNTFKRWSENLISPLSKILITGILCLFAILILVFFSEAKNQLLEKLRDSNSYDIYLTEQVRREQTPILSRLNNDEEALWEDTFGPDKITIIQQPFQFLKNKKGDYLPLLIYNNSLPELQGLTNDHPTIWLLRSSQSIHLGTETLYLDSIPVVASIIKMPQRIHRFLEFEEAIAIPSSMATNLTDNGYHLHLLASFDSTQEVEAFAKLTDAYYTAQERSPRTFSTLTLLKDINTLNEFQAYVRIGITISCGLILSFIIGTIAWLEYRQESYLLALLQSFGTSKSILLIHTFFENFLLVTLGLFSALFSWGYIYNQLSSKITILTLQPAAQINIPQTDISILFIAASTSIIIALIPIAFALRKPAGLILQ